MELLQRFDPVLAQLGTWGGQLSDGGRGLLAIDLAVPDAALVGAFALAVVSIALAQRGRHHEARRRIETLYQAELLTANRRAQQARGDLRSARQEIERERQKRRREAADHKPHARLRDRRPAARPATPSLVATG